MSTNDLTSSSDDLAGASGDMSGAGDMTFPADGCTTERLCSRGMCYAPGEFRGCGICRNPDPNEICRGDADCQRDGRKEICISGFLACTCMGQMLCRAGCMGPADCGEGQVCSAGYRCIGQVCAGDAGCPANFACSAEKRCARKSCTGSDGCAGHCVKGQCYSAPGQCGFPAA